MITCWSSWCSLFNLAWTEMEKFTFAGFWPGLDSHREPGHVNKTSFTSSLFIAVLRNLIFNGFVSSFQVRVIRHKHPSHYTHELFECFVFISCCCLWKTSSAFHLEEDWHLNLQSLCDFSEPAELEQHGAHFPQQTQVVNTQELEYTANMWMDKHSWSV